MRTKFQQVIDLPNGFGSLKFGFTRGEVENVLGRPDEEDLIDETEMAAIWYYKRLKLSVSFYAYPFNSPATKDMPLGVVTFMTGSPSATLWGSKIVGRGKSELLKLFEQHGHQGFTESVDELAESGYEALHLEKRHISLVFYNGTLKRLQWDFVRQEQEAG